MLNFVNTKIILTQVNKRDVLRHFFLFFNKITFKLITALFYFTAPKY